MIIGLSGYAQSGKDTTGRIIQEGDDSRDWKLVAYADKLREFCLAIDPIVWLDTGWRYSQVLEEFGYEDAKKRFPEFREILQRIGTEGGRQVFWDDFWVDLLFSSHEGDLIITDVRFVNEAEGILKRGGEVWRIERPGVGPANSHVSEKPLPAELVTRTIVNDGALVDLADKVAEVLNTFPTADVPNQ